MKTKRLLSAIIAGAMTATTFMGAVPSIAPSIGNISVSAASEEKSGTCGDNVTWELDDEGTLTISGSGDISYASFLERTDIKKVIIENGVTSIGESAFFGCSELTSLTLPDGVENIGESAFQDCSELKSITIPEGVESIGDYAFACCKALTGIIIPDSVTSIGNDAFLECSKLTNINIPDSVEIIKSTPFKLCTSLKSINVSPDNNKYADIDGVLYIKDKTVLIEYPIGKQDREYIIPESVTSIDADAFNGCSSLKSMNIPNNVEFIDFGAFFDCSGLTDITINNPDCIINDEYGAVISNGYDEEWNYYFDGTIHGYNNSTAQTFAEKYGYKFESLGDIPIPVGDSNGDRKLNVRDAAHIAKMLAQGKNDELPESADFNGDGKINVRDAAAIANHLAKGNK